MRAEGMLSCRSLSFRGTTFRLVPVALKGAHVNAYTALEARTVNPQTKRLQSENLRD